MNNCEELIEINLPNRLISIGDNFMNNCKKINKIILPNNLINIGKNFMSKCENLEYIKFTHTNKNMKINDENLLFFNISKSLFIDLSSLTNDCVEEFIKMVNENNINYYKTYHNTNNNNSIYFILNEDIIDKINSKYENLKNKKLQFINKNNSSYYKSNKWDKL